MNTIDDLIKWHERWIDIFSNKFEIDSYDNGCLGTHESSLCKCKEVALNIGSNGGWHSIENAMPEVGKRYEVSDGKVIIIAFYAEKFSIESDNDELIELDYCQADDKFYLPAGWYESNECDETNWFVDLKLTHYKELPKPPNV